MVAERAKEGGGIKADTEQHAPMVLTRGY
jgi:hypothetical protein